MAYLNNCFTECRKIQHMIDLRDTPSVCNITSHNFINICYVKLTALSESQFVTMVLMKTQVNWD